MKRWERTRVGRIAAVRVAIWIGMMAAMLWGFRSIQAAAGTRAAFSAGSEESAEEKGGGAHAGMIVLVIAAQAWAIRTRIMYSLASSSRWAIASDESDWASNSKRSAAFPSVRPPT